MIDEERILTNTEDGVEQETVDVITESDESSDIDKRVCRLFAWCQVILSFFSGMFTLGSILFFINYMKSSEHESAVRNLVASGLLAGASVMCMISSFYFSCKQAAYFIAPRPEDSNVSCEMPRQQNSFSVSYSAGEENTGREQGTVERQISSEGTNPEASPPQISQIQASIQNDNIIVSALTVFETSAVLKSSEADTIPKNGCLIFKRIDPSKSSLSNSRNLNMQETEIKAISDSEDISSGEIRRRRFATRNMAQTPTDLDGPISI